MQHIHRDCPLPSTPPSYSPSHQQNAHTAFNNTACKPQQRALLAVLSPAPPLCQKQGSSSALFAPVQFVVNGLSEATGPVPPSVCTPLESFGLVWFGLVWFGLVWFYDEQGVLMADPLRRRGQR
jgi:hypothetical protein